jgi:transmembrane sensor
MSTKHPTIDDTAAEWVGRRDGGLNATEEKTFAEWLRADPRHQAVYARLADGSAALTRLRVLRPAGTSAIDPDLPLTLRRRSVAWLPVGLAAAAAIVIGFVVLRPGTLPRFPDAAPVALESVRNTSLPDGSRIELNAGASVEVAFSPAERRVRLTRGEAHFAVAKDPARPFVVEASGVAVRAVGTAFNVRLGASAIEILVTEGKVRVDDTHGASLLSPSSGSEPPVVAAGERVTVPSAPASRTLAVVVRAEPAELARLLAWQERRLEFEPTPLAEVVAAFNRVNNHQIVIADTALSALLVGGSFKADDPDTLVRLLEANFGVAAERESTRTVLRAKK